MSPDDICLVCQFKRDEHGDMQHEFSLDGNLRPKRKPEPARASAPGNGPTASIIAENMTTRLVLRMVERLIERGLLVGDDLTYVFGGDHGSPNNSPAEGTQAPDIRG